MWRIERAWEGGEDARISMESLGSEMKEFLCK